ncbi:MAG: sugar ABC transporter permease [Dehalococcoidales bacterium]|nr:sugar ABC transporter permease [Dehalococcoidales bacterium]
MKWIPSLQLNGNRRNTARFFLWTSPWFIGFIFLTLIPMIGSLYISFTEWKIIDDPVWVGIANYQNLFADPIFLKSLKVTFTYAAFTVPTAIVLSLALAMLLNNDLPYSSFLRTIYYLPSVLSPVAAALLWTWVFNHRYGLINQLLGMVGVAGPAWLGDEGWSLIALSMMSLWSIGGITIWGIGGGMIFYLAGLQAVPQHLHEAAKIAGASWWRRLFTITLPSMSPILLFTALTSMIGSLQTFLSAYLMTEGGPNYSTMMYGLYLFLNAFDFHKMGKACAMAWIMLVFIALIALLIIKVSAPMVYYSNKGGEYE